MSPWLSALSTAINGGCVVVLAGMGGLIMERAGVLNLGLEGIVSVGAVGAVIAASGSDNVWWCLFVAMMAGMALSGLFGLVSVIGRANQVLIGLAVVLIGTGLANNLGRSYSGRPQTTVFRPFSPPLLTGWDLGDALFRHDPLVYLGYVVVPLATWFFLFRTRWGLNLRAVGEHPAAADTTGVSVLAVRFATTLVGGALAGAGGASLTMSFTPGWAPNTVAGKGWVALAVIVFAAWRPGRLVFGAFLFGAMISVGFLGQAENWGIDPPLLSMLPYVVTLVLPVISIGLVRWMPSLTARLGTANPRPGALGTPYFREER